MTATHVLRASIVTAVLELLSFGAAALASPRIIADIGAFGELLNNGISSDAEPGDQMLYLQTFEAIQVSAQQFALWTLSGIILGAVSILLISVGALRLRGELVRKG